VRSHARRHSPSGKSAGDSDQLGARIEKRHAAPRVEGLLGAGHAPRAAIAVAGTASGAKAIASISGQSAATPR
jgi:hypothetical protein